LFRFWPVADSMQPDIRNKNKVRAFIIRTSDLFYVKISKKWREFIFIFLYADRPVIIVTFISVRIWN